VSGSRILIGRFGAPHGVRGEVRLKSFASEPRAIATFGALLDADGRSYQIEHCRPVKDDIVVARIAGVRDRDAAAALTNRDLYVDRAALPPPDEDEFYLADLIGLAAVLADGAPYGVVRDVLNYGAGDILEIATPEGQTALLPFTKAVVPTIDVQGRRVIVAPPVEVDADKPSGD
jgi:16S rRNA processing protein RimM